MKKMLFAAGIAAAVIAIGCSNSPDPTQDDINNLNDVATGESAAPSAAPVKKVINAGTWTIGAKTNLNANVIVKGTYVISVPTDGFNCYWETVKNLSGEGDYLIKNGNVEPGTSSQVTITASAKALQLQGDCIAAKKS